MSMLDWELYRSQILSGVGELAILSPGTVKGYSEMSAAGTKTNHLDSKTRELIALAVAISLRCDGCIAVHVDAAQKLGASQYEIAEASAVAISVNAGAAMVYSARAMDALAVINAKGA